MISLLKAGGWIMFPIVICSLVAFVICVERSWSLRRSRITPKHLVAQVWGWIKNNQLDKNKLRALKDSSPLGEILAAGLVNHSHGRDTMKESIQEAGRLAVIELERFLNTLGTIAQIAPLLGLLGTVIGMIRVFTIFHRHFERKVDELVAKMEQEALKMVEVLHGERETVGG